jgi:NAD(P)-dependent dehydrogenase (short-subunit alcohol dehydrogenase family)
MKTALVTGASRGIGRGIAQRLAERGFGLTITSRSAGDLDRVAADLRSAGSPDVGYRECDMADRAAIADLMATHTSRFGSTMNSLVINAGVGTAGPIGSFRLDRFDKTIDVNLTSALLLIQGALPSLRAAAAEDQVQGAKIIAMSSITGVYAEAGLAVYGASKAALLSLVETVNLEESSAGVTATAVAPAYVDTDMAAWITDKIPAHTMIPVADVVSVVDMILGLSRSTAITRVVMGRSGTSGRHA